MTTPWQEVRALAEKATAAETVARHAKPGTMDARIADDTWHAARAELSRAAMALLRDPAFIGMMEAMAWVPVSERLPPEEMMLLVTIRTPFGSITHEAWWDAAGNFEDRFGHRFDSPVIAWHVLPEPFTPPDTARASSAGEGSDAK
jgi:hypothetical protein